MAVSLPAAAGDGGSLAAVLGISLSGGSRLEGNRVAGGSGGAVHTAGAVSGISLSGGSLVAGNVAVQGNGGKFGLGSQ